MKKIILYQSDILKLPILIHKESHSLYHYHNKVIKIVRYDIPKEKEKVFTQLEKSKLRQIKYIQPHANYLIPDAIIFDEYGYRGYCMKKVDYPIFHSNNILEICHYYKQIEEMMEYGHQQGILFPDILSYGNIVYDKKKKQPIFLDFDGWQIKNIPAGSRINLEKYKHQICSNPKFKQKLLYQINFDRLILLKQFLYHLTNIDLFSDDISKQLHNIILILHIQDNPLLIHELETIFHLESTKKIPTITPIIEEIEHNIKIKKKH